MKIKKEYLSILFVGLLLLNTLDANAVSFKKKNYEKEYYGKRTKKNVV